MRKFFLPPLDIKKYFNTNKKIKASFFLKFLHERRLSAKSAFFSKKKSLFRQLFPVNNQKISHIFLCFDWSSGLSVELKPPFLKN